MNKKIPLCLLTILMMVLSACSGTATTINNAQTEQNMLDVITQDSTSQVVDSTPVIADFDDDDFTSTANEFATSITLNGDSISAGEGVTVDDSIATITAAGTYEVSGTLNDGQLIVETEDEENVTLLLAGANIHNESGSSIYVANAEKVIITLVESTENNLSDGANYANLDEDGEPNATLFSKDDLTINGAGTLNVSANYNNGIASKDDLKITGGNITVNAVNDGIKGRDSIAVLDANITVNAGGDGMQSNNDEDLEKGYIAIENGTFNITAGLDGIQAETRLLVSGGDFTISAGGGSINTTGAGSAESAKGIKAGVDLTITGGTFEIDAADDALHSNDSLTIDDGVFLLESGDDGIHSEYSLTINGGDISVLQSFEGLESALITINDGNIHLATSDDGLNATTGYGGEQADSSYFYINGGYVLVNASGDGLDSNGTAVMTGGTVIVQGPTTSKNGPLDINGEFEVSGGVLIVAGSAGMPETPSTSSTQNSIALALDSTQPGGTLIHVETADGEDVLTYESPKDYQLFVFSSPELETNTTYTVYVGGESTGTVTDGLYSDGTYTPGTQVASLEISSSVTTSGTFQSNGGGSRGGGKP